MSLNQRKSKGVFSSTFNSIAMGLVSWSDARLSDMQTYTFLAFVKQNLTAANYHVILKFMVFKIHFDKIIIQMVVEEFLFM